MRKFDIFAIIKTEISFHFFRVNQQKASIKFFSKIQYDFTSVSVDMIATFWKVTKRELQYMELSESLLQNFRLILFI